MVYKASLVVVPFAFFISIPIFVFLHQSLYRVGIKKIYKSPIPVIGVGNLTVGGTGKTPLTIALVKLLIEKGYKPGVVSRGYKGTCRDFPHTVTSSSHASFVGDEPLLIAEETGCPVVIAPKRKEAVEQLLQRNACNVIVADDCLQHYALHKDIEVLLVDADRGNGNGWCLPAGPLRESPRRFNALDFWLYHEDVPAQPYSMSLALNAIYNLADRTKTLSSEIISTKTFHAVAGIGHPERFFKSLRKLGYKITEHAFPDHHTFVPDDFLFCGPEDDLIMTQKDAVKCVSFAQSNYWVLPVTASLSEAFVKDLLAKLQSFRHSE